MSVAVIPYRQILSLYHRSKFYLDLPMVYQILQFREVRKRFYTELWQTAARNVGADFEHWKFGYFRLRRDGLTTVVQQSRVMLDDQLTLNIMGNKILTYELMREKGAKVPDSCAYTLSSLEDAKAFMARQNGPVVVKPASGTGGGRGVSTGITSLAALKKASRLAARSSEHLLVEEQIEGDSYRLLYLDGQFIDAIRRDPPTVTGDGRHTIRQLIKEENKRRLKGQPFTAMNPLLLDRDCRNKLRAQDLRPGSRPAEGEVIVVKQAINANAARENHTVKDQVHPDLIEAGADLVKALGVRFAGLDWMCSDISLPLSNSDGRFNEVNTTPGIHHHYLVAEPDNATPVAERLLEHMFTTRQGVMAL
ncbi:MAG: hypothetical protein Q8P46_11585 [Hyphomicrobiales bacterium]|nr:hypothetical protein [Hyphomicrobiales bacterium]